MKLEIQFDNMPASARWFFLCNSYLRAHQSVSSWGHAYFRRLPGRKPRYRVLLKLRRSAEQAWSGTATDAALPEAWRKACDCLESALHPDGELHRADGQAVG